MPEHGSPQRPVVQVKLLRPGAQSPRYQSHAAAGLDLHACCDGPILIQPGTWERVPTGIAISLPEGHEGQVRPRSGLAARHGITVLNAPGTIDADYRGEVQVLLVNLGNAAYPVAPKSRIAQLVVAPVTRVSTQTVDALDETPRGSGGFGSTGNQ